MDTERTYTVAQVAEYLQVNRKTVYRWLSAGLPALNVGGSARADYRLRLGEVERWLNRRQQQMLPPRDEFGPL